MKLNVLALTICAFLSCALSAFAQGSVAPHIIPAEPAPAASIAVPAPLPVPMKKEAHPPSIFDEAPAQAPGTVVISVATFRRTSAIDVLSASPYPVRPPKATKLGPCPDQGKGLRQMLLMMGYQQPQTIDKPYPAGGLRMQFIMRDAVRKSGLGYPHGIGTEYPWADQLMPYAAKEAKLWNNIEDERWERFQRMQQQFETERTQCEVEAARLGLYPVQFRRREPGAIRARLEPGNWWITCTRKVPGLTYYWQVPITVTSGETQNVTLSDVNALLITGAW